MVPIRLILLARVAVAALPLIDPEITLLKVLVPAQVWAPVVTAPEADELAAGIVALVPAELVIIGPPVVPPVTPRFTIIAWVWVVPLDEFSVDPVRVLGVPKEIVLFVVKLPPPLKPFPADIVRSARTAWSIAVPSVDKITFPPKYPSLHFCSILPRS